MMRGQVITAAVLLAMLSACAASSGTNGDAPQTVNAPESKRRGLEPTETNDGGLRQAPPPPEDGESANPEGQPQGI